MSLEAKIELLTTAVVALTAAVTGGAVAAGVAAAKAEKAEKTEKPVGKPPASAAGGGDTPSPELLKQINGKVNELVAAGKTDSAKGVLAKHGAKKTSQLGADVLPAVLAELSALVAADATGEDEGSLV